MAVQEKIVTECNTYEIIISENIKKIKILENNMNNIDIPNSEYIRLSKLELGIGTRVLRKNIFKDGMYPIYSANVFQPFGYSNDLVEKNQLAINFSDFLNPSVIWGIDGDWMVNYIEANKPFIPTDHCGILRCKNNSFNMKYLAYILNREGITAGFSRNYRASIDRVGKLQIPKLPIDLQNQIAQKLQDAELTINNLQKENEEAKQKQKDIINEILLIE
jgi:type I restriction enzyme M protein